MYGTTKSSYENLDRTRLIIRHKKEINAEQMGARARNIQTLFIENEAGERFKYPYNHLAGARAMSRHVANGGLPHDEFGKHIIETSSNIAKLTAFKRYVQNKDFMNQTSNDIIEGSNAELENLRTHIKKLQTQSYYTQQKENFVATDMDNQLGDDVVNDLTNAFTIPQFNEDLTDMFPLLHSIHQKRISETTVDLDKLANEGFDPEHFDGEVDFEGVGDDGETTGCTLYYTATIVDGRPVVHPKSFHLSCAMDGNSKLGYDADTDLEMQDPDELMAAAQEDADDRWANRDNKYAHGEDIDEFESWANDVVDENLDNQRIAVLNKLLQRDLPVGPDGTNAISSLEGIIDDITFVNDIKALAEKDADADAKPLIYSYVKNNMPEAMDDLDFGDMSEADTTDVVIGKDGSMSLAGQEEEPKDTKSSAEEVLEFVRSFYDKETGAFPKGETGVVISARKRFGDSVGDLVEKFVSKLTGNKVQLGDEVEEEKGAEKDNHGFSDKQIKMAYGVLNDKRYKGGNYSGAVDTIEKIAKGLSDHPGVKKALRKTNEDLNRIKTLAGIRK